MAAEQPHLSGSSSDDEPRDTLGSLPPPGPPQRVGVNLTALVAEQARLSSPSDDGTQRDTLGALPGDRGQRHSTQRERLSIRGRELEAAFRKVRATPTFAFSGMKLSGRVHDALKQFDVDGDEELDMREVTALVEHVLREERQNVQLRWALVAMVIFTVVLLAGMFGLTWVVVVVTKDTKVDGNTLKTTNGQTVLTGSAETTLNGGVLVDRSASAASTANTVDTIDISSSGASSSVIRTGQFTGTKVAFTSLISTASLMELNYLALKGQGSAEVMLRVNGVARVPQWDSYWGTVVVILTPAGTITLDNTVITFDDAMEPIFSRLNFTVTNATTSGSRRVLLQAGPDGAPANDAVNGLFNVVNGSTFNMNYTVWDSRAAASKDVAATAAAVVQTLDTASTNGDTGSEANLLAAWSDWKRTFVKPSSTANDDYASYANWRDSLANAAAISADKSLPYWGSANQLSDRSLDQLNAEILANNTAIIAAFQAELDSGALAGLIDTENTGRRLNQAVPDRVNWQSANKVTPIKDQQSCGNCWAHASVAAVESAYLINQPNSKYAADPTTLSLSVAQVTFCTTDQSYGCNGGVPPSAVTYMATTGLTTNAVYPMPSSALTSGANSACVKPASNAPKVQLSKGWTLVSRNNQAALMAAVAQAPVIVYFQVVNEFYSMAGGTYTGKACPSTVALNHAMVIVGYNLSLKIWLVRNSWGTGWGNQGYVMIAMTGDDQGTCGIQMIPVIVTPGFSSTLA